MLPAGYTQLLLADTRRALAWERGLARAGFDVCRREARGGNADKADWVLGVASAQLQAARSFVGEVLQGRRNLPLTPILSRSGLAALVAIGAVIAAIVAAAVLGR